MFNRDSESRIRDLRGGKCWCIQIRIEHMSHVCSGLGAIRENLHNIALPFIILHGENDTLCHPSGSHLLYKVRRGFFDKTFFVLGFS